MVKSNAKFGFLALFLVWLPAFPSLGNSQELPPDFNERGVRIDATSEDRGDINKNNPKGIYVLDFHFKDPRVIPVDIPGRGRRFVWYMWYQVSNNTGAERTFLPDFVWVFTTPGMESAHRDQILPTAQRAIQRLEDPTGVNQIENSVTIAKSKVPYVRQFDEQGERIAFPKRVTGVAMWDDIPTKATHFDVYVYGLSDGWSVIYAEDGKTPIIRRKTLRLRFRRLGDELRQNSDQIRFEGHEWLYATMDTESVVEKINPMPALKEGQLGGNLEAPPGRNANPR